MSTEVLRVDPHAPDPVLIERAAAVLRTGRLVAFPTETVYGLGANALDAAAVRGIFAAKGRPPSNPVIVHVHEPSQVRNVAADWPEAAAKLAAAFWPGPLTLVVPKLPTVPDEVTAGGPTVAVRCPRHPVARALIAAAGVPVAAPSANRSTELSPTLAEHVLKGLNGRIDLVLDGGPCTGGIESTVVDVTGPVARLLRPGLVTVAMLEAVVGPLAVGANPDSVARSPGLMARHYSPRTPVVLAEDADAEHRRLRDAGFRVISVGVDLFSDHRSISGDPVEYAAELYAVLHELDDGGFDRIVVALPPDAPEWAAVRDRLTRAAAPG
ncbi:L-threonylcarbamoyladenylate synthase [Gemmata sp.]|uniref:L-threonylcarbamoyladenylate synthase n=1 Tax=Gemmata sp. TaxID=1914242 RepID=UPI003F71F055